MCRCMWFSGSLRLYLCGFLGPCVCMCGFLGPCVCMCVVLRPCVWFSRPLRLYVCGFLGPCVCMCVVFSAPVSVCVWFSDPVSVCVWFSRTLCLYVCVCDGRRLCAGVSVWPGAAGGAPSESAADLQSPEHQRQRQQQCPHSEPAARLLRRRGRPPDRHRRRCRSLDVRLSDTDLDSPRETAAGRDCQRRPGRADYTEPTLCCYSEAALFSETVLWEAPEKRR